MTSAVIARQDITYLYIYKASASQASDQSSPNTARMRTFRITLLAGLMLLSMFSPPTKAALSFDSVGDPGKELLVTCNVLLLSLLLIC